MFAYRPGAVRAKIDETPGMRALGPFVTGMSEPAGTQVVYLREIVGIGDASRLLMATLLALERLGGRLNEPMTEAARREYSRRIGEAELLEEMRRSVRKNRASFIAGVVLLLLLLPLMIPVWIGWLAWRIVSVPWRARRLWRMYRLAMDGTNPVTSFPARK